MAVKFVCETVGSGSVVVVWHEMFHGCNMAATRKEIRAMLPSCCPTTQKAVGVAHLQSWMTNLIHRVGHHLLVLPRWKGLGLRSPRELLVVVPVIFASCL